MASRERPRSSSLCTAMSERAGRVVGCGCFRRVGAEPSALRTVDSGHFPPSPTPDDRKLDDLVSDRSPRDKKGGASALVVPGRRGMIHPDYPGRSTGGEDE